MLMNVALNSLPQTLPRENAVRLELEQGVIIFRASSTVQHRIEELLEKERVGHLSSSEKQELDTFEEIDDYLSYVNRLIRDSHDTGEVGLAS